MSGAPWLNAGLYWVRIARPDGRRVAVSTGTRDKRTAKAIARMVIELEERAEDGILSAVTVRRRKRNGVAPTGGQRRTLLDVFTAYRGDTLDEYRAALDDADIEPMIATWHAELVQRGLGSAGKYLTQVRTFIAEGKPFPRSQFRRKAIAEHLASLDVTGSTLNRHRAALMQFGRWLVEREILETNPVRDVRAARENPSRMVSYAPADVQRLVERLTPPYQAFEAVMAGTGMELQAVLRTRRRDVDLAAGTIHAHGGKTEWRDRVCVVTEAWTWPMIVAHAKRFTPDALLFAGISYDAALAAHDAACAAAKLPRSTLHDHRHTYAVTLRRRGVSDVYIARQLGHHDTVLVARNYGRFTPDAADYLRALQPPAPSAPRVRVVR